MLDDIEVAVRATTKNEIGSREYHREWFNQHLFDAQIAMKNGDTPLSQRQLQLAATHGSIFTALTLLQS